MEKAVDVAENIYKVARFGLSQQSVQSEDSRIGV